ncbi:sulfotransferase family protein [Pseudoxanthomonas mexicana]
MLTRSLMGHGCALSEHLLGANFSNPSGHWESAVAIEINDELLKSLGRTWDDLRDLPAGWQARAESQEAKQRIKILIERDFKNSRLWAIKEPRMCRLAPLWIEAIEELGFDVRVVLAMRPVTEVALSLLRRDGMRLGKGSMLWLSHVLDAERWTRCLRRVVVSHQAITSDWRAAMRAVSLALDIEWPISSDQVADELDAVISKDMVSISPIISEGSASSHGLLVRQCDELYMLLADASESEEAWGRVRRKVDELKSYMEIFGAGTEAAYAEAEHAQDHVRRLELASRDVTASLVSIQSQGAVIQGLALELDSLKRLVVERSAELASEVARVAEEGALGASATRSEVGGIAESVAKVVTDSLRTSGDILQQDVKSATAAVTALSGRMETVESALGNLARVHASQAEASKRDHEQFGSERVALIAELAAAREHSAQLLRARDECFAELRLMQGKEAALLLSVEKVGLQASKAEHELASVREAAAGSEAEAAELRATLERMKIECMQLVGGFPWRSTRLAARIRDILGA